MNVGIIGSGDVGRALANAFLSEGEEVMVGTRDPAAAKLADWRRASAPRAKVGTFAEAAQFADIAVLAVRGSAAESALALADPGNLMGKLLIDVTNPLSLTPEKKLTLSIGFSDSLGERVQRAAPGADVVKTLNIVNNANMYQPRIGGSRPEMFLCGNAESAKAKTAFLLERFGWTPVDVGTLDAARLLEPLSLLGIRIALASGNWNYVFRLVREGNAGGSTN